MPDHACHEIIAKSKQGDKAAFRQFVEQYQRYVYAIAFRFLCHEEEAKDVTQESFIRIWKNLHRFDFRTKVTTWMYTITSRICIDRLKARARRKRVMVSNADAAQYRDFPDGSDPENTYIVRESGAVIEHILKELPPKQRMVFVLRDGDDLDIGEIADILGISKGSVKSNLCHARRRIREKLNKIDMTGADKT